MKKHLFCDLWTDQIETSPIGPVWIAVSEMGLVTVQIGGEAGAFSLGLAAKFGVSPVNQKSRTEIFLRQIDEYLLGVRKTFAFPINWGTMSAFQQKSLSAVYAIPYGVTRTYGQIAAEIGIPRAPRAVGRANATNPMPLVIPCHRLIGADGSLRGYGAGEGIKTKQWLLTLERSTVVKSTH